MKNVRNVSKSKGGEGYGASKGWLESKPAGKSAGHPTHVENKFNTVRTSKKSASGPNTMGDSGTANPNTMTAGKS